MIVMILMIIMIVVIVLLFKTIDYREFIIFKLKYKINLDLVWRFFCFVILKVKFISFEQVLQKCEKIQKNTCKSVIKLPEIIEKM